MGNGEESRDFGWWARGFWLTPAAQCRLCARHADEAEGEDREAQQSSGLQGEQLLFARERGEPAEAPQSCCKGRNTCILAPFVRLLVC